jgi:hypothetical protein
VTESLYLLGPPGVGKSTLLKEYLRQHEWTVLPDAERLYGHLYGHPMIHDGIPRGVYLGKARERFPGTDALSMAVAPDARAWARSLPEMPLGLFVCGEGARLGNPGFLRALGESSELTVALLTADQELLDERCAERGSKQNAAWRKGAATGARRAFDEALPYAKRAIFLDANRWPDDLAAML